MPYDNADTASDFKAIADGAKSSPEFKKMTGEPEEEAAEGAGAEVDDLKAAFEAEDPDTFAANMLAAIKSCIKNYGTSK